LVESAAGKAAALAQAVINTYQGITAIKFGYPAAIPAAAATVAGFGAVKTLLIKYQHVLMVVIPTLGNGVK
jgi:hypothetical protein